MPYSFGEKGEFIFTSMPTVQHCYLYFYTNHRVLLLCSRFYQIKQASYLYFKIFIKVGTKVLARFLYSPAVI